MFDAETLIDLGLSSHVISIWQVFLYIALMIPFLFLQRTNVCLMITYLFTYYLAFLIYWGELIATAGSLVPFFLYTFSGLAIVVLYVAASFYNRPEEKIRAQNPQR
ncbi:MAG: hypothetical protein HYV04_15470 [Deltaproteobacteria bacterium]|nr:hypothetical protein [Deltaproteobacteria bacterium]